MAGATGAVGEDERFNKLHDKLGQFASKMGMGGGAADRVQDRVKGRDLVDELDYDRLQRSQTSWVTGGSGDDMLGGIQKAQGFDGKPGVVGKREMDRLVAEGHQELFRGIEGGEGKTAAEYHEQFRSGQLHPGLGTYGNGTYTTPDKKFAARYSDGKKGSVARMALHPDAKVVEYDDLFREIEGQRIHGQLGDDLRGKTARGRVLNDPGRYAAAKGFDAIRVSNVSGLRKPEGGTEVVVLNRSALVVERG